jgi:hopanoid biosynthesis associated protein HpnK
MTETKSVIFTADDFGASAEVNAGILRAYREGVLRGTSLMVAAPAREAAAAAARDCPGLDVGLHLVVCKGQSVLPPAQLGGLVDSAGRFVQNPVKGGMRYFFNRGLRSKIADECRAQIELHLRLIGYLNHIDGHLNFHVHPVINDILLDLASEYRVPCIRLPREPVFTTLALAHDNAPRKLVEAVIFRALSKRARRKMTERGIKSTDWLFGLHQSGNLSEHYMLDVVARLSPGVTEIYTHPAADIGGTPPPAPAQREVEILTSPLLPIALAGVGVRLTNFAELARADGSATAAIGR